MHGLHDMPVDAALADPLASAPDAPWQPRLRAVAAALTGGTRLDARGVRAGFSVGVRAIESCPTALLLAFSHRDRPIGERFSLVRACGGDTDTIGAMAGAIWGAYRGLQAVPRQEWTRIKDCERICAVAQALHARA